PPPPTDRYTLSLHDALPILPRDPAAGLLHDDGDRQLLDEARDRLEAAGEIAIAARLHELHRRVQVDAERVGADALRERLDLRRGDRKSTRLNSSHVKISYAV